MATKPKAWQEQGPVNSLDEWVNESGVQGEERAPITLSSLLQDKKAPKAEPEEDIDVLEPEAEVTAQQENQTSDATKMKNHESKRKSRCTRRETQEIVTELEQVCKKLSGTLLTQEESEELVDLCEQAFPPPPSNILSAGEYSEKAGFSSLEGEVADWISDVELISNPADDLNSLDSQNSQEMPQLIEPVDQEEMTADIVMAEANVTQLNFLADGISASNTDNNKSQLAHHSAFVSNNSGNVDTVSSPPFADESEEEEELIDNISCQQQWNTLDICSKASQPSHSVSDLTYQGPVFHATPSVEQQEELLPQSHGELTHRGENQEAAQQVLGQGSPPLSTVAMELSNQGGATPQGSGCVVSLSERLSRAGKRAEGENQQTGVEEGQKESRLERNKAAGQQHYRGLLYSQIIKAQELKPEQYICGVSLKHSRHTRMEYDSCDDSQSDSGVSADFSPCSAIDGTTTTIATGTTATVSKETPIEREIRRAIEREQSLRRSRGLPNPPRSPEYVEIPLRKSVLCQSLPKSERHQGKDREFAGKKMKHEIHAETQREQDLVKLGKVPGFYDKGTVRQIKEKKDLFEAFQTPSNSSFTPRSMTSSWSSASETSTVENQEDFSVQMSTTRSSYMEKRRSLDLLSTAQGPNSAKAVVLTDSTPRGPGFSDGTGCQVIILESNLRIPAEKRFHIKPEAEAFTASNSGKPVISSSRTGGHDGLTVREKEKEKEVAPMENPFFKLRSSTNLVKVKQDIQEAQEREKELQKQRISLYGDGGSADGGGRGRPISMEVKNPVLSSSLNGLAVPDFPGSSSREVTGPSAARQSVGKPCVWPPAQPEEEKIYRPEVPQSPRTPRQKTPLVQCWESGLVNGHITEND
uniref:A-kinase anchor protein 2 C-terminal domain-containing protein n=1 Tax=Amphiprion percula TaxID=161767 RepID=A0A3P8U732_AMPPE